MNFDNDNISNAPPQTPARLAAAAEASGIARMGKLRAALAAALRGALTSTDYEVRRKREMRAESASNCERKREREGSCERRRRRRAFDDGVLTAKPSTSTRRPPSKRPQNTPQTKRQEFRACFPDFADDVTLALHDLYRQVLHAARAHSEAEFEEICQDAGVLDALAAAEAASLAAEGGPPPEAAARGARVAAKKAETARLREALAKVREERVGLEEQLRARRADAAAAARRFARVGGDLEPLAAAAARVVVD